MGSSESVKESEVIELSHKEFLRIDRDYEKAAEVAALVYVKADTKGITRIKKEKVLLIYMTTNR